MKGVDHIGICVCFLCHDGKGNFLFSKRSENCRDEQGIWDCGGGTLDFGNTIEQQLRQEIKEEYCTDVIDFEFLEYGDVFRKIDGKDTHWVSFEFLVQVDPDKVKNGEPHKFDDIGWFTLDNLPSPLHSELPRLLNNHMDRISKKAGCKTPPAKSHDNN